MMKTQSLENKHVLSSCSTSGAVCPASPTKTSKKWRPFSTVATSSPESTKESVKELDCTSPSGNKGFKLGRIASPRKALARKVAMKKSAQKPLAHRNQTSTRKLDIVGGLPVWEHPEPEDTDKAYMEKNGGKETEKSKKDKKSKGCDASISPEDESLSTLHKDELSVLAEGENDGDNTSFTESKTSLNASASCFSTEKSLLGITSTTSMVRAISEPASVAQPSCSREASNAKSPPELTSIKRAVSEPDNVRPATSFGYQKATSNGNTASLTSRAASEPGSSGNSGHQALASTSRAVSELVSVEQTKSNSPIHQRATSNAMNVLSVPMSSTKAAVTGLENLPNCPSLGSPTMNKSLNFVDVFEEEEENTDVSLAQEEELIKLVMERSLQDVGGRTVNERAYKSVSSFAAPRTFLYGKENVDKTPRQCQHIPTKSLNHCRRSEDEKEREMINLAIERSRQSVANPQEMSPRRNDPKGSWNSPRHRSSSYYTETRRDGRLHHQSPNNSSGRPPAAPFTPRIDRTSSVDHSMSPRHRVRVPRNQSGVSADPSRSPYCSRERSSGPRVLEIVPSRSDRNFESPVRHRTPDRPRYSSPVRNDPRCPTPERRRYSSPRWNDQRCSSSSRREYPPPPSPCRSAAGRDEIERREQEMLEKALERSRHDFGPLHSPGCYNY